MQRDLTTPKRSLWVSSSSRCFARGALLEAKSFAPRPRGTAIVSATPARQPDATTPTQNVTWSLSRARRSSSSSLRFMKRSRGPGASRNFWKKSLEMFEVCQNLEFRGVGRARQSESEASARGVGGHDGGEQGAGDEVFEHRPEVAPGGGRGQGAAVRGEGGQARWRCRRGPGGRPAA